jgi:hypothetical protein
MGVFKTDQDLYQCLGTLFEFASTNPEMGQSLGGTGLIIRFTYTDPDAQITIDTRNPPKDAQHYFTILTGPNDLVPEVKMSMKADIGHQFWLGKVNLVFALARRQIVAEGPIPKILKLLPLIKPAYAMYPKILKQVGREELAQA